MKLATPFLLLFFIVDASAQFPYENIWIFGKDGNSTHIEFSDTIPFTYDEPIIMETFATNASICDTAGNLLCYTNGVYIADASHQPMENGEGLNPGEYTNSNSMGYNRPQATLFLPQPNSDQYYYLFHLGYEYDPVIAIKCAKLYYSKIDMSLNNGLGAVIEKNQILREGTFDRGDLTAVRHANGRDWWIFLPDFNTHRYFRFVLSPNGIEEQLEQWVGTGVPTGLGQAVFSPDGTKYARLNLIDYDTGGFIDIYDFDRCSGLLSNHLQINYIDSSSAGGAVISPNSRFLYIPSRKNIFQYDLLALDIKASKVIVAEYDGFQSPFSTYFFMGQVAPDDKIYVNAPNSVDILHVIHNPNEKGLACNVEQHGFPLPVKNAFSLPNMPYFRLGALPGSPCDTLHTSVGFIEEQESSYSIFPNPASNHITVTSNEPIPHNTILVLYDVLGNSVDQFSLQENHVQIELNIASIPQGLYFCVLKHQGIILQTYQLAVVK